MAASGHAPTPEALRTLAKQVQQQDKQDKETGRAASSPVMSASLPGTVRPSRMRPRPRPV